MKLKDWKPVTLILVIEDYAQKLPAAIAQYHITIWYSIIFLSEDIGLMVHFLEFCHCNSIVYKAFVLYTQGEV